MNRDEALQQLTAAGQPYELVEVEALGRRIRAFKNAPPTLRRIYETTRSDLPFLVYEDERLTFEETWRRACTLAHALRDRFQVQEGDRVAISMRNYPEWMISFCAVTSIGAVAVALNALWGPDEMAYGLADSGAKVLIADAERLDRLAVAGEGAPTPALIGARLTGPREDVQRFEDLTGAELATEMPASAAGPDDDAIMLYTSGSTGRPKGAVSTHRNVISALLSWELDGQAGVLVGAVPAPVEGAPQAVTLLAIPLFHVTGLHAVYLMSYRGQRRIVSMYKWDPEKAAELIERERVTSFTAPSAMTGDLLEHARRSNRDLSSLATVGGGGAARAPEQVKAIDSTFANAKPNTGWGMTETNAIGAGIAGDDYLQRPESSGRAAAVLDLRIVGEDGRVQGPRGRGELQVRGASIIRGYWNRPEANAEAFDGEWLRTGDVAYLDEDGFVFIVDRIKDLVIRGGENISCAAVEAALLEHPDVLEASVYGTPDRRLGEEVAASLHVRRIIPEAELRAFLEPRLARFQIPKHIHFEADPLPRLASGKIDKRQLRNLASARLASASANPGATGS